ncbi:MAG TPA: rod shape-determining protein RodA [Chitinophagales bacterium]|nr:rod shape-determining protein RodA [Chitinophagales bacterium]
MKKQESLTGKFDWLTVIMYALLTICGWFIIYSASAGGSEKSIFDTSIPSGKQFQWMIASVIIAFVILLMDSRLYVTLSYPIFAVVLLLIFLVMVVGDSSHGQKNWLNLGAFKVQPSEFAKFGVSLGLAKYMSGLSVDIRKWRDKWKAFAWIVIPMGIVLIQGDAGSAIVFLALALVLFREGLESYFLIIGASVAVLGLLALLFSKYILVGVLFGIALLIIYFSRRNRKLIWIILGLWLAASVFVFSVDYAFGKLKPHQKDRINVLLGKQVQEGRDWNIKQSIIAIGSGGVLGKGYLQGTQTKLKFVPEQSTDFIFSSLGEEFGFVGCSVIIILFVGLFFRLLFLAERQRSRFSRVYGYCVACILFFHFLINVGMVIGVAPVIGIPLPFISYGGSALLSFTVLLFILIRLDTQRFDMMR